MRDDLWHGDSGRCADGKSGSALRAAHLSGIDAKHFRRCDLMPTLRARRGERRSHFLKIDLPAWWALGDSIAKRASRQPALSECPLLRLQPRSQAFARRVPMNRSRRAMLSIRTERTEGKHEFGIHC